MNNNSRKVTMMLGGLEALYYVLTGTITYLTVFLKGLGLSATKIGLITSLTSIIGMLGYPAWGIISDRLGTSRKVLMVCVTGWVVTYVSVYLVRGVSIGPVLLPAIILPITGLFRMPGATLLDGMSVPICNRLRVKFSSVRLWGSIGFAATSLLLGFIVPKVGLSFTFYILPVALVPFLSILVFLRKEDTGAKAPVNKGIAGLKGASIGGLFKNYWYVCFLIFAIGMTFNLSIEIPYMPYILGRIGEKSDYVGYLFAFRGLMEGTMMFLMYRLRKYITMPRMLLISGVLYSIEYVLYTHSPNLAGILLGLLLSSAGSGIMFSIVPNYISSLVPSEIRNTAMTIYGSLSSLVGIICGFVAGYLIDTIQISGMTRAAGLFILTFTIFFAGSLIVAKKVLHLDAPAGVAKAGLFNEQS